MTPCELVADNDRLSDETAQLRASLATVAAELDAAQKHIAIALENLDGSELELAESRKCEQQNLADAQELDAKYLSEWRAHAETRKALEVAEQALIAECENVCSLGAALAGLDARVKELEHAWAKHMIDVQDWDESFVRDFAEAEGIPAGVAACILEALRNV